VKQVDCRPANTRNEKRRCDHDPVALNGTPLNDDTFRNCGHPRDAAAPDGPPGKKNASRARRDRGQQEAPMRKKDETIDEIGKGLRRRSDEITREALPCSWVDLIRRLNEKERERKHIQDQPEPQPRHKR
jgi:hypothetical protein